jgi:hypothetical protein
VVLGCSVVVHRLHHGVGELARPRQGHVEITGGNQMELNTGRLCTSLKYRCLLDSCSFPVTSTYSTNYTTSPLSPLTTLSSTALSSVADPDRLFLGLLDPDPLVSGTDPDHSK